MAKYERKRRRIPSGAPESGLRKPVKVAILVGVAIISVGVLIALASSYRLHSAERKAAVVRQSPDGEARRAELLEDLRLSIDATDIPIGVYDLRREGADYWRATAPGLEDRVSDLEIVAPGEMYLYRQPFGYGIVYSYKGYDLDEIRGQIEHLATGGYSEEDLQAALARMIDDGRIAWWMYQTPPPPPAEEDGEEGGGGDGDEAAP